jgi:MRG-binding protein
MRGSPSVASTSPAQSPTALPIARSSGRPRRSKLEVAGLVDDSDSSALTQESGDEVAAPTPSVVDGTDAGTEDGEEDEDEEREDSPCTFS